MRGIFAVTAIAAILTISGCGATNQPTASTAASDAPSVTEKTASSTVASEKETVAKLGQAFTWENDVTMTVGAPKPFKPSQYAARDGKFPTAVAFVVKLTNGGTEALEPGMAHCSGISGGEAMGGVFDSEKGFEGEPTGRVLPGKSVSYKLGFEVKAVGDIQLTCAPGFDFADVTWTS